MRPVAIIPQSTKAHSLVHMVEREREEWDMLDHYPMRKEQYFRFTGSGEMNMLRKRALNRQNLIWRWLYYGSPDFKEYEEK